MGLPEWCQKHTLKEFLELMEEDLGSTEPKKGNNMNDQVQNTQPETVELTPEQAAKLAELAMKLEQDGEVFVQTEENVGTEKPTVH